MAIGDRVASRVSDGSTLQMGIGGVPDATLNALTGRRGLRVWTEMFSDGVLELDRVGALDQHHPLTASFLFGSRELYDWLDGNHRVRMMRTEHTNDPGLIAQQRMMTSVNTALEVDLFGQANASRINAASTPGSAARPTSSSGRCTRRRAVVHRAAVVAPEGERVDRGAAARRAGHELPAECLRHRARHRRAVGYDQQAQCRHIIRDAAHPAGARRAVGGSRPPRPGLSRFDSGSVQGGLDVRPFSPRGRNRSPGQPLSRPGRGWRGRAALASRRAGAEMVAMTTTSAPDSPLVVRRAGLAGRRG
jgi:hypothetical protein